MRNLALFIVGLAIFSCAPKTSKEVSKLIIDTEKEITLKGEIVFPDLLLARPYSLLVIGNKLLIADKYENKFVTSVDLDNSANIERLVHEGKGPNEILNLRRFYKSNNTLSIYDDWTKRMSTYEIKNNQIKTNNESLLSSVVFKDNEERWIGDVMPLGDQYISHHGFEDKQLCLFDKEGVPILTFGTYPGSKEGIANPTYFHYKNEGNLAVSPDQKHFVLAGKYNDQLTFYKVTEADPQKVKEYFSVDSNVEVISETNSTLIDTSPAKVMYSGLAPTNKQLYMRYSEGLTYDELKSDSHDGSCTILAFDWDGNLEQIYKIPEFLSEIVVDEKNNCLYGLTWTEDGEAQLMKYQL